MDQKNRWIEDGKEVEKKFYDYFTDLSTTSNPTTYYISAGITALALTITTEMNQQLDSHFTAEEIYTSLCQMNPTKAPRPDGLPDVFY